jgi:hypothetical protein
MRMLLLIFCLVMAAPGAEAASLQARLIRATNDAEDTSEKLKDIRAELKKQFGYQYYQLLGERQAPLRDQTRHRLDLGQGFVLYVKQQSVQNNLHKLEAEWFSAKTLLVNVTVKIPANSSLLVKGPAVGNDWIVLALTVRPE